MGAIHSTKISGNFGLKLNGSVRSNRKSFEKTGPPFEVVLFSRSDRSECWLNGSRPIYDASNCLPQDKMADKLWARTIQTKFQPVRPGKVVHLKRRTRFFETFRLDRTDPLSFGPKFPPEIRAHGVLSGQVITCHCRGSPAS